MTKRTFSTPRGATAIQRQDGTWLRPEGLDGPKRHVLPIFRHCWGCMVEVTPSRRCVVDRLGNMVHLAPIDPAALERLCLLVRNGSPLPNPHAIQWDAG